MISLYPVPDRAIIYNNDCSSSGGDGRGLDNGSSNGKSTGSNDAAMSCDNSSSSSSGASSSSSDDTMNSSSGTSVSSDLIAVSVMVTLGVEVAASPLFIPHKGTVGVHATPRPVSKSHLTGTN